MFQEFLKKFCLKSKETPHSSCGWKDKILLNLNFLLTLAGKVSSVTNF